MQLSANLKNLWKYSPILAETAKIGGYLQKLPRFAEIAESGQD
jgi:hypothetical protein